MIYVAILLATSILPIFLSHRLSRSGIAIIVALLLATFAGLRGPGVAADFHTYESWYWARSIENGFLERPGYFEILYILLNDTSASLEIPFRLFLWGIALVAICIKVNVISSFAKNREALVGGIAVYAFSFYLLHEFTQLRVGLALAFVFLAFRAILNGNRCKCLVWIMVAMGFHSSSLLALLLIIPHRGFIARTFDIWLCMLTMIFYVLAMSGVAAGLSLVNALVEFDPRVALYVANFQAGLANDANPMAITSIVLLILALSLTSICRHKQLVSPMNDREMHAVFLIRRYMFVGLCCTVLFFPIPELAQRILEFSVALLPLLGAILFSERGWLLQKTLILIWTIGIAYHYIMNAALVNEYVLYFS